jgi:hypothetical protein
MNPTPPHGIGCRLIAEFEDDAGTFTEGEAEFVAVEPPSTRGLAVSAGSRLYIPFIPPTDEALATAKKFWLKVIRRFTESVPGKKGHCAVRDSAEPNQGRIVVEYGTTCETHVESARRYFAEGYELDFSDKSCLTLFSQEGPDPSLPYSAHQVKDKIIPIPWSEIVQIQFEVRRPASQNRHLG